MKVVYDPLKDKSPKGTNFISDKLEFRIRINVEYAVNKVDLVLRHEKTNIAEYIEMHYAYEEGEYNVYECSDVELHEYGLYWYHFEAHLEDKILYVNKDRYYLGSIEGEEEFPLTVIKKEIPYLDEYQGGIIYHIFVDRFNKVGEVKVRDGFVYRDDWGGSITKNTEDRVALNYEVFGGNLKGIIAKLDYLQKLGVTTIYLSPIFMAPSNHKYDTSDYSKIDDMFGDETIFQELIDKAKEKGIGIVLDGVFNHIGSDSVYFNKENHFDSIGAYNSKESPYYDWFDFFEWPEEYRCWWGIKTLPSVNQESETLGEYLQMIIRKYMSMGIQGFRLDVVDELQHQMLNKICTTIRSVKDNAVVIGEVWEDASTKISYGRRRGYFYGDELNSVMNYPFKDALIDYAITGDVTRFHYVYQMIENNYPEFVRHNLMNIIGSHDTRRIYSILKEHDNYFERLKVITGLQYTCYGVPAIFYGDEVGIEEDAPDFSRKCYPWGHENKEILDWYKILNKVRKHNVFKRGKMRLLNVKDGVICFERYDKDERILIITNLSDGDYEYNDGFIYKSFIDNDSKKLIKVKKNEIDILIKA